MIHFRQATGDDIPRIMDFIDTHWRKGHIMAVDRKLFEFQHIDPVTGEVTYLLAEDDDAEHTLYGTMGYVLCNHREHPDAFTMMIKMLNSPDGRLLGEEIGDAFRAGIGGGYHIGVGINPRYARAIDTLKPGQIGELRFWYRLRPDISYRIAEVSDDTIPEPAYDEYVRLERLTDKEELRQVLAELPLELERPYRDEEYIYHRYAEHPYYDYLMYSVKREECTAGLLIARVLTANDSRCLRIMDWYGDDDIFRYIGGQLDLAIEENACEYADMACFGVEDGVMRDAGFLDAGMTGNIIPDHFEPFERKASTVYVYCDRLRDIRIFKAFADQDRPNIIRAE